MKTQKIVQQVFNFIYDNPYEIIITKNKNFLGMIFPDKLKILISVAKVESGDNLPSSPAITFIHEILHDLFPDYKHPKINSLTKEIWENLTDREKLCIYEFLFQ